MTKKYKILTLSDHPMVSSGVGLQTRYIIEGLLATEKYQFRSLGGAIKHKDYRPQKVNEYGDDWIIFPTDGYGDENIIRNLLDVEKPDAIWAMTDPRFYIWLFNMSDEIRDRGIPLLYYHVWDNYPVPDYNKGFYHSCDFVGCISKLTHDILCKLDMEENSAYIPHAVNADIFKQLNEEEILDHKQQALGDNKDKFIVFYNSRNARRKQTSDVVKTFKMFLDKVGQDKAFLLMHTDPHDKEGANLLEVAKMLGLKHDQIAFSSQRVPPEQMTIFYNIADVTMSLSNNEGWGLSLTESLYCGTPLIANYTGGMRDQIRDKDTGEEFGVALMPATKSLTGSQEIPYIFDDRSSDEDVVAALLKMYNLTREERRAIGEKGKKYALTNFDLHNMIHKWDEALMKYIAEFKENGYKNRIRFERI